MTHRGAESYATNNSEGNKTNTWERGCFDPQVHFASNLRSMHLVLQLRRSEGELVCREPFAGWEDDCDGPHPDEWNRNGKSWDVCVPQLDKRLPVSNYNFGVP